MAGELGLGGHSGRREPAPARAQAGEACLGGAAVRGGQWQVARTGGVGKLVGSGVDRRRVVGGAGQGRERGEAR